MIDSFKNKHVWIIGASSGIGRALAKTLHEQGATLALSARSEDKLHDLNEELDGRHHVYPLDVTNAKKVGSVARALQAAFPRLDSVVFLAAIYRPMDLDDMDIAVAAKIVNVNVNGALNVVHAILPVFEDQGGGQIAITASVAGYRGLPHSQPYAATKAALINLTESLRVEKGNDIDVKVINPGFVKTPMTDKNEFEMPMIISPEEAAGDIVEGLTSRPYEIHFPKRFTFLMKALKTVPRPIYERLARALNPKNRT